MTLTEAENMQSWIYHMSVEEFASWLEAVKYDAERKGHEEGYAAGYNDGSFYD